MYLNDTSQTSLQILILQNKMLTTRSPLGHSASDQNRIAKLTTMISND